MYVVCDLETTGFSPVRNNIIEIAMALLTNAGGNIKRLEL
jgi:DNA polymerase III alpha subunit (gram-positive type)